MVDGKGLTPEDRVVVYGYDREERRVVAERFSRAGFADVALHHDFLHDWSNNATLPMERLPGYRHLVSASWLNFLLRDRTAPEYDNRQSRICHAHYRNPAVYEAGHIPTAAPLDTNPLESPDTWNRCSADQLREALLGMGITRDTAVIVYERTRIPAEGDPFPRWPGPPGG